jgi:ArsR family transcriptional regulator
MRIEPSDPLPSTVRLLKALSDGTRLRLLRALAREEANVAELCQVLDLPQPTVSRHLAVLRESGLLRDRREGQWVFYSARPDSLDPQLRKACEPVLEAIGDGPVARRDASKLARVLSRRREAARRFYDVASRTSANGTRQSRFGDVVPWRSLALLVPRDIRIVDLGTGTGDLLPYVAPRVSQVFAIDFSARMLALARARSAAASLDNVSFIQGDLESMPLREGFVEGVVASLVLHHAARPAKAVQEMARILKPGGRAVVVDFLPHTEEWLRDEEGDAWLGFEPATLRSWFERAGFGGIRVEEGPPPAHSGRRDRPGADRRLKRLRLLWLEAEKMESNPGKHRIKGAKHDARKLQRRSKLQGS